MEFNTALNRIIWRFQKCEVIHVNKTDIDAVNSIVDYYNDRENQIIHSNEYFAKLYVFGMGVLLKKYNTSLDNPIIQKELHYFLKRPFENIVEDFTNQINETILFNTLEHTGFPLNKHPAITTEEEIKNSTATLQHLLNDPMSKKIVFQNTWKHKEVIAGLKNQINNFLNGL